MITFTQKEYSNSGDVIKKASEILEKDRIFEFEISKTIAKDNISVTGNLGNLEIWIPQDYEFLQYSIDDFLREILPYAYTNVKCEARMYKMSVKGKLTQAQYTKLLKHIIKEAEFVTLVED